MNSETKTIQVCLLILTTIAVSFALTYTKFMLVPFVFSIFTYAVFTPFVYWIQDHLKLHRLVAITISLFIVSLVSTAIIAMIFPTLKEILYGINNYEVYTAKAMVTIEERLPSIHLDEDALISQLDNLNPISHLRDLTSHTFMLIGNISLVIIYTTFMLVGGQKPSQQSPLMRTILMKIFEYTIKKTFLALAAGMVFLIVLGVSRVELVFIFALSAFLLNFIPTIGPMIAVALPFPVVFYHFGFEWQFFVIFSILGSMQFIIGNIVEPSVLGDIMDLHPITVLICLVFWGLIWGVSGMFLAVPITAVLKIILERIDATHTFAEILAGRLPHTSNSL